jgi:ubiquinone/menaquinone biosynthesis C-methylase UbiE
LKNYYVDIFNKRGHLYNNANERFPSARAIERDILLDLLDLGPDLAVCDAPAGGGYVAQGIDARTRGRSRVVCVEPSANFARAIDPKFQTLIAPLDKIPLDSLSMDRVASLAGLHDLKEKTGFLKEAFRILKPGARFAVGDVMEGTAPGHFLNDSVNRYTETGHHGVFLRRGELTSLMSGLGFVDVREQYREFFWSLPDFATLVEYCHLLFGMVKATLPQVEAELRKHFVVEIASNEARLPWSLVYAVGIKSQNLPLN